MISNKTTALLFLFVLSMKIVASSSTNDIQEQTSSDKTAPTEKRKPSLKVRKTTEVLRDETNNVNPVDVAKKDKVEMDHPQKQSVPSIDEQFKKLIDEEKYEELFKLEKKLKMKPFKFMKQLSRAVKTRDQYNGIVNYLKRKKMVSAFYMYGDINIVKEVITQSGVYDNEYADHEGLGPALAISLRDDLHDRAIELLETRKELTIQLDIQLKRGGGETNFERFVNKFLFYFPRWMKTVMAFKRFLTFRGEELKEKHPDILSTLCQEWIINLRAKLPSPETVKILIDLIGQTLLLTSAMFAIGLLCGPDGNGRSFFIKHGWREAIEEGLKKNYPWGGEQLWQTMREECPHQFSGELPSTTETFTTVLKHFPSKQELEIQWIKNNVPGFIEKLDELVDDNILPNVIVEIIFEYARPTWLDIEVYNSKSAWKTIREIAGSIFG